MEIWKDVINYEGLYQVSNLGNIRSVDRVVIVKDIKRHYKGKTLKQCKDGHNYSIVSLSKNNNIKTKKIHILVCESFLSHKTCGFDLVVDHKDSNKNNNALNNLQIVTQRFNSSKERTIKSGLPVGVTRDKKCKSTYMSRITINGVRKYLGCFINPQLASEAYNNELKKINNYE